MFFIFTWFSLKTKALQAYLQKSNTSSCYSSLATLSSVMQLRRFSQFSIFTEFYVLADIVIDIISKVKKSGGTSRDRDQGCTYKS